MSIDQQKHVNYEQSAGKDYEQKLGGLHADPERMQMIADPILEYIDEHQLGDKVSMVDLGGGTGNLLKFIKQQISEKKPDLGVVAVNLDINPKQVKATQEGVFPIVADAQRLPIRNVDIEISRNVYHYLSVEEAEMVTEQAYSGLKPGGIFINAFVSSSPESQGPLNDFWTKFATEANVKKEETKRYFATQEEMKEMFEKAGFINIHFEPGFENTAMINGSNGLAGKYPSLTPEEINSLEKYLLSLDGGVKEELKISAVDVGDDNNKIKTVTISQPVYIIYGEKPNN